MEIKKDFIKTEYGEFPKNWTIRTIQSLIEDNSIIGHLDGNHGELYPKADEFKNDGVPYITANDLTGSNVDFSHCKYLSSQRASVFKKGIAKDGDVLFAHNATVGPTGLLKTDLDYVILSTTATYYRCNRKKLNNIFLLYLLQSPMFIRQYRSVMAQSTRFQVPITTQRKLSVFLPESQNEQDAIANALSDADAYIESLEKLIAKKRLIKKSLLQKLFTPKKNWKLFRLGDCATLKARIGWQGLTTAEYLAAGDYGLVTGTDFKNGKIDWDNCHYVNKDRYDQDRNIQIKENDILVTKDGTIGKVALISFIPQPTTLNSGVFVVRPINNAFDQKCFYYLLSSSHFDEFLAQLAAGSTISHLYQKDFIHFKFKLPDPREQIEIGSILFDADCDIEHYEKKLKKAHHLKQGMMQELLTGRIRLV